jgi:uncharacterized membrane protein
VLAALLGVTGTLLAPGHVDWQVRAVVGWDLAATTLTVIAWWTIVRADAAETRRRASAEDPGRVMLWVIALGSSAFSLFAATFVIREVRGLPGVDAHLWTALALLAVLLSWLLTHTSYTLRYAHLYYRGGKSGGLEFPGGHPPADIDFAYFSFTIGMCFQVSDVVVSDRRLRRAALGHALLSFVYNTTILALALNMIFGLLS